MVRHLKLDEVSINIMDKRWKTEVSFVESGTHIPGGTSFLMDQV